MIDEAKMPDARALLMAAAYILPLIRYAIFDYSYHRLSAMRDYFTSMPRHADVGPQSKA